MKRRYYLYVFLSMFAALHLSGTGFSQIKKINGVAFQNHLFNENVNQLYKSNNLIKQNDLNDLIVPPYIKETFLINELDGEYGADQNYPSIAMDGSGNFAAAWLDRRNSKKEIFIQFYNSSGEKIGSNFKVNESDLEGNNLPIISCNSKGDFIVVWLKNFSQVIAQRFDKFGNKLNNNISVNTSSALNTGQPSLAVSNDGSFLVTWSSEPGNWEWKVYARLFDFNGLPLDNELQVNTNTNITSIGNYSQIAVDSSNNYCVVWSGSTGSSSSEIYAQLINQSGLFLFDNTLISDPANLVRKYFPVVSSTKNGHFLIAWQQENSVSYIGGIGGRVYTKDNLFASEPISILEEINNWNPCIVSSDKESIFYINFLSMGNQYIKKIGVAGNIISDTIRVKYNSPKNIYSYQWGMTDMINEKLVIAAGFYDRHDQNIYFQIFDTNISPIGNSNRPHDDTFSSIQKEPTIKTNNLGNSLVIWKDSKDGKNDLYGQLFNKSGDRISANFKINDSNEDVWETSFKEIVSLSDGSFIVAFIGSNNWGADIVWLQKIDADGNKLGSNLQVKSISYYTNYRLMMNRNSGDEILVCWYNDNSAFLRRYDKNLTPLINEKKFIGYIENKRYSPFYISADTAFNVFATWKIYDITNSEQENKFWGQFFNKSGAALSNSFIIDSTNKYVSDMICQNNGQDYVIVYKDYSNSNIIRKYKIKEDYIFKNLVHTIGYYPSNLNIIKFENQKLFLTYNSYLDVIGFYANDNQRYSKSYLLYQYNFINPYYENYNLFNSSDIFNNTLLFAFQNSANDGSSDNIYGNIRQLENIEFKSELFFPPVTSDFLYNNFPNPFNPKTKIVYDLLAYHKVKLSVYNILGQEVKVLVDKDQEKGLYEVEFDATGLASGIYFYRLEAFDTSIKKMIYLK